MKIDLIIKPEVDHGNSWMHSVPWKKSLPFLHNPRAYLIHRVKSAHSYLRDGEWSHDTCEYWCGNVGRGEFVNEPPNGSLLCAACEAAAVVHGQPPAEELVGHHVCTGRLRAIRLCCKDETN